MIEPRRYYVDSRARLRKVMDEISHLDVGPERVAEIIVRAMRREKTHDQRALFHAICGDIGLEIGLTIGQVKRAVKVEFYGEDEFKIGDRTYREIQSSEDSDRAEYSRLIDFTMQWASENGILIQDRRHHK